MGPRFRSQFSELRLPSDYKSRRSFRRIRSPKRSRSNGAMDSRSENRPRDEHRDQGHPKNLAGTECSSPRHAHFSVPVSSIRFQATDEAKRLAERVSLPNSLNLLSLPHVAQGLNTDDWTWNKDSAKTEQAVSASLWPPSFGLNDARGPNLLDLPGPVAGQV
jgi:hypothetical protein